MHEKFLDEARNVLEQYNDGLITEEEATFKLMSISYQRGKTLPGYEVELTKVNDDTNFLTFLQEWSIDMRPLKDGDTTMRFFSMSYDAICRLIDTYWVNNTKSGKDIQAQREILYTSIEVMKDKEAQNA